MLFDISVIQIIKVIKWGRALRNVVSDVHRALPALTLFVLVAQYLLIKIVVSAIFNFFLILFAGNQEINLLLRA